MTISTGKEVFNYGFNQFFLQQSEYGKRFLAPIIIHVYRDVLEQLKCSDDTCLAHTEKIDALQAAIAEIELYLPDPDPGGGGGGGGS